MGLTELKAQLKRPIAFYREFVSIAGSVTAGLMLSQAYFWSQRLKDGDEGWFFKTADEWERETGLSRWEQETARQKLREKGFCQEERRGRYGRLHTRIDMEKLSDVLANTSNIAAGSPMFQEKPHRGKTSNHIEEKPQTSLPPPAGPPLSPLHSPLSPPTPPREKKTTGGEYSRTASQLGSEGEPRSEFPHRETYLQFLCLIGADTDPKGGANNEALAHLFKQGYSDVEILRCTEYLLTDPFYRDRPQPLSLTEVRQCIAKWISDGQPLASRRHRGHTNGAQPYAPGDQAIDALLAIESAREEGRPLGGA